MMSLDELYTLLNSMQGFSDKVVFDKFKKSQDVKLPYINIQALDSNSFGADNKTYFLTTNVDIEFYSARKDISSEQLIEQTLNNNDIYFNKREDRIDSQNCYQVVYEIGV